MAYVKYFQTSIFQHYIRISSHQNERHFKTYHYYLQHEQLSYKLFKVGGLNHNNFISDDFQMFIHYI
jgi:hypothetical protein